MLATTPYPISGEILDSLEDWCEICSYSLLFLAEARDRMFLVSDGFPVLECDLGDDNVKNSSPRVNEWV